MQPSVLSAANTASDQTAFLASVRRTLASLKSRSIDPTMFERPACLGVRPVCDNILVVVVLVATICSPELSWANDLRHSAVVRAVNSVRNSVVNIHGHKTLVEQSRDRSFGDATRRVNGMGTGVVIDARGYIITNHHVVDGVREIRVTLADERDTVARLVAHDPKTDLAIIKIPSNGKLPTVTVGTSKDLMAGETVIAVGNAYGYEHTVTKGIISALHRSVQVTDAQSYNDLIQTDASINPGNSGGPLLNIDGEMIGINVAVRVGAQGIGFALPVDEVMNVASRLLSVRNIDNRWHGLKGETLTSRRNSKFVVTSVGEGSPADRAGFEAGDIVSKVDEYRIVRALDFERALLSRDSYDDIEVRINRSGKTIKLSLDLSRITRLNPDVNQRSWNLLGFKLEPVSEARVRKVTSRYRGGLRVMSVRPSSPASAEGIQRGDILVGMHVWETISLENVAYIMNRDLDEIAPLKFYVLRGDETLYGHLTVALR